MAKLPVGPYRVVESADGQQVPIYIIPFDKRGQCVGPLTRDHLVESVSSGNFTDVFLFSHGWNNDFPTAIGRYEHFIDGFIKLRKQQGLTAPDDYKPLLVGVYWPSTALTFGSERGPQFAAEDPKSRDPAVGEQLDEISLLADALPHDTTAETISRLYELGQKSELDDGEAKELAKIMLSISAEDEDEISEDDSADVDSLVEVWREYAAEQADDFSDFGTADGGGGGPQAAGIGNLIRRLDPRPAIRLATVWKMKDRAGIVGAHGVGPLLRRLLSESSTAKVHLIGHSYGAKVVLSATCFGTLPRPVESMLLLQPAVSHLCFAKTVPGTNRPGGYHEAPDRVNLPILSTFSDDDFPLTKTFHFAVRRNSDLGEANIAAAGTPPSKFAALGGFGPRSAGQKLINIQSPGQPYSIDASVPIYGLQSTGTITGHGEISNPATWWALHQLVHRIQP